MPEQWVVTVERTPPHPGRYEIDTPQGVFEIIWDGKKWLNPEQKEFSRWRYLEHPYGKTIPNKLSVVVTGRNDNYDGNFEVRLVTALSRNMESLPEAEFIFVEWNPIMTKPRLSMRMKKIFCDKLRCYCVHPKFHQTYCTIDQFLEYPAKNVGIRRATGDFILSTNSDVILSPDVTRSMRWDTLDKGTVYRTTRVDVPMGNLYVQFPLSKILERNEGLYNASGDYLFLHRDAWNLITGYCEEFPGQRLHKDSFAVWLLTEAHKMPWKNLGDVSHWRHPSSWSATQQRAGVGDIRWDFKTCGFSRNKDTWGLTHTQEVEKEGVTWLI